MFLECLSLSNHMLLGICFCLKDIYNHSFKNIVIFEQGGKMKTSRTDILICISLSLLSLSVDFQDFPITPLTSFLSFPMHAKNCQENYL